MIQLEYGGFEDAVVPICTLTLENTHKKYFLGSYIRLSEFRGAENQGPRALEAINNPNCEWLFRVNANESRKIPDSPISYSIPEKIVNLFEGGILADNHDLSNCIQPGDGDIFLRLWTEISIKNFSKGWRFISKGGNYRKWYGNIEYALDYSDNGKVLLTHPSTTLRTADKYFQTGFVWTRISSGNPSFRYWSDEKLVTDAGPILYSNDIIY